MPRTMRVEYPGAIYHVMIRLRWGSDAMNRGDLPPSDFGKASLPPSDYGKASRREDIVSDAHQVDCGPGANWVFQRRQVGATSLGAWPRKNQSRSSKSRESRCAARIRIYGLTPFPKTPCKSQPPSLSEMGVYSVHLTHPYAIPT